MTDIIRSGVSSPQLDGLDEMLAMATRRRAEAMRQVETFDRHIENLKRDIAERDGVKGGPEIPPVTSSVEFAGMRTSKALEAYLKRRSGFEIPISRVVKDLLAGGLDPGKPHSKKDPSPEKNLDHKLKIVMRQNEKLVRWDENWTMRLADTATQTPKPRKKYKPRTS